MSSEVVRASVVLPVLVGMGLTLAPLPAPAQCDPGVEMVDSGDGVDGHIRMMEQAFEQAVARGVGSVEQQLPSMVPGLLFFAGSIQARGFALEGYGLFFDVEYPAVRRSILWSMGALNQLDANMVRVLASLRQQMSTMQEGPTRVALGEAVRQLEAQVRSSSTDAVERSGTGRTPARRVDGPSASDPIDPVELYRTTLTNALVDVLVTSGQVVPAGALGDEQWLTVAARDSRGLPASAGERRTLLLRVRGRDLSALHEGQISEGDLRARVEEESAVDRPAR